MNLSQSTMRTARSGITIIEVLTSIIVALIGVFGVLILIPFAVQQAQAGLDSDMANNVARNSFARYEIEGFRVLVDDFPRWTPSGIADGIANDPRGDRDEQISTVAPYAIDPLMATSSLGYIEFPNTYGTQLSSVLTSGTGISTVNLMDPRQPSAANPMEAFSLAMARRMCQSNDDLSFGEAVTELGPPQQIYDTTAVGAFRRQSYGRMSWMMVANPVKDNYASPYPVGDGNGSPSQTGGWKYRINTLVFEGRAFDANVSLPRYREVAPIPAPAPAVGAIGYGGGTVQVGTNFSDTLTDVRRDDWVMLVNETVDPSDANYEAGFEKQIGFYRVIGVLDPDSGANTPAILTLEGPDFAFQPVTSGRSTYIVHLVQYRWNAAGNSQGREGKVVNVFERSMRWEQDSSWN